MMAQREYVRDFFNDPANNSAVWLRYFEAYVSMPNKAKDAQKFRELDCWYHALDVSRGYVTKAELLEIMKWKLTRGKMRPLLKKIEALTEDEVRLATYNGINAIRQSIDENSVKVGLEAISKPLKGVGPATASAVLAKWNIGVPFMSDAGLIAVNGTADYKISDYLSYYRGISEKVAQLNADGMSEHCWTAKQIEAVLHIVYCRFDLKVSVS